MTAVQLPSLPALVVGEVSHSRRVPLRHSFSYRAYQWLVDVDDLPRLPRWLRPLARFDARDHFGGAPSLREGVQGFLSARGVHLEPTDRVVMLANARVLGHVFNPLTVFWAMSPDGALRAVVFEVHNTYGQRHCYLLEVDERGRAQTEKELYVSPFNDVSGRYDVRLRLDPDRISVSVALNRNGDRILMATTRGVPRPATQRSLLRVVAAHFLMTHRVTALIRFNGIRLWLRRLPVVPRPVQLKETLS